MFYNFFLYSIQWYDHVHLGEETIRSMVDRGVQYMALHALCDA